MQNWVISANGKIYDHASAFQKLEAIDWKQRCKYSVGDVVYIYCTRPYKRIMYKTVVVKESIPYSKTINDEEFWIDKKEFQKGFDGKFARLKLVNQADNNKLSLDNLITHGLKAAPQGPVKIDLELAKYIDMYLDDNYSEEIFPDSDLTDDTFEGAKTKVYVNKYERSSIARQKCIEYNGNNCAVCGMNFEEVYGDVGKDFIHVHHIIPLNEIGKEYIVNYKKDLIPVCPNCHAMLHRKIDGKYLTVEELRERVKNKSR